MTKLSDLTTIRVGGTPKQLLVAKTTDELISFANRVWDETENWLLLGGGSNVVVNDSIPFLDVIQVSSRGIDVMGNVITVQAGENWHEFVRYANSQGWAGIESLAGIPGTVGAAPIQNIGAYGQEVSTVIQSVEFFDYDSRELVVLSNEDCEFGYRDSVFKRGRRGIVTSVSFVFDGTEVSELEKTSEDVLNQRRAKGMVLDADDHDTWSCGSFFVNPLVTPSFARTLPLDAPQWEVGDEVKLSAAWLIENAGLTKGFSLPNSKAAISTKHALAITNRGGATSEDIVELASFIQTQVGNTFGIYLVPEPNIIGF
ncbi:MAG: UDP-N-acetylmuramate dehydrogenase [Actinobacteria bacterium]|nr:UDP-N-acetylmuramate dehydrogenase [Actinomycetota bacterium]